MPPNPPGSKLPLEAWVEFTKDKTRLNEYQVKHHKQRGKQPPYTECFVECVEGEEFAVGLRLDWSKIRHDLDARLTCDGSPTADDLVRMADADEYEEWKYAYVEQNGKTHCWPLRFSPAATFEENEDGANPAPSSQIGSLVLKLKECNGVNVGPGEGYAYKSFSPAKVDERHSKLGATSIPVGFGDKFEAHPVKNAKAYRFVFKYRSRAKLELMDIIRQTADGIPAQRAVRMEGRHLYTGVQITGGSASGADIQSVQEVKPTRSENYEDPQARIRELEEEVRILRAKAKGKQRMRYPPENVIDLTADES